MLNFASGPYRSLTAGASYLQSPFLLAVRLYWGWQFAQTGWGHLTHLDKVRVFFGNLGTPVPALLAPAVGCLELAGGILLVLGLGSRLIALLLACTMVEAFLYADRQALLSVFSDPDKLYGAAPYTFLMASLIVLIFGPGRFSIDWLIGNRPATRPDMLS